MSVANTHHWNFFYAMQSLFLVVSVEISWPFQNRQACAAGGLVLAPVYRAVPEMPGFTAR
jgi:hypothetical protein